MSVKFGDFLGKVRYSKRMGPEFEKMKIVHDLQWHRIIVSKLMLGVPGKKEKRKIDISFMLQTCPTKVRSF